MRMDERCLWEERVNGAVVRRFIASEQAAAEQTIADRRKDGEMYTVERLGPEPLPYRTIQRH